MKGLAAASGLDASAFSGHSARVGMTQDLAASGSELPAIVQAGRWKSPTMPARHADVRSRGVVRSHATTGGGELEQRRARAAASSTSCPAVAARTVPTAAVALTAFGVCDAGHLA